jgi:hypothetical protein
MDKQDGQDKPYLQYVDRSPVLVPILSILFIHVKKVLARLRCGTGALRICGLTALL